MYPPHFPIQLSSSLPNMSLLTSCLFLKKRNVNNPLSPISVAHMCKGVGPCTRTWESFQRPHPQEEWLILFPQKLSTDNNSSVREGAVLMVGTTSALSSSCDSMSCPEMACHRLSLHPAALTSILPPLPRCSQSLVEGWGERVIFMSC